MYGAGTQFSESVGDGEVGGREVRSPGWGGGGGCMHGCPGVNTSLSCPYIGHSNTETGFLTAVSVDCRVVRLPGIAKPG